MGMFHGCKLSVDLFPRPVKRTGANYQPLKTGVTITCLRISFIRCSGLSTVCLLPRRVSNRRVVGAVFPRALAFRRKIVGFQTGRLTSRRVSTFPVSRNSSSFQWPLRIALANGRPENADGSSDNANRGRHERDAFCRARAGGGSPRRKPGWLGFDASEVQERG